MLQVGVEPTREFYSRRILSAFCKPIPALQRMNRRRMPIDSFYINGAKRSGVHLLRRLISDGFKSRKCECCLLAEWNGREISLEVDHINGVHDDNRLENLRVLCPNCHAQTETYKGKNIAEEKRKRPASHICQSCYKQKVSRVNLRCKSCAAKEKNNCKIDWPSNEALLNLVAETNFCEAGRILGVTDNAIRKRLRLRGLL